MYIKRLLKDFRDMKFRATSYLDHRRWFTERHPANVGRLEF